MIPKEEWWKLSESERVSYLIREVGPSRLGNFNGCICSSFSIRNVDFDLSCGKGGGPRGIVITSCSMDYREEADYHPIIEALQEIEFDYRGPIEIRVVDEGRTLRVVEIQNEE